MATEREEKVIEMLKSLPLLEANLKIAQMRVDIIHTALATLTEDERTVICKMVIEKENEFDVGFAIYGERSTVYRKRKEALRKLETSLFGNQIEQHE